MKVLEFFKTSKFRKIALFISLGIFILYIGVFIYSLVFEQDKLTIDRYNFEQLEKAKSVMVQIPKDTKKFSTLKEFNSIYKVEIKPINNCYYTKSYNGSKPFIFGFQLESLISKFIYFGKNYAYPSYDLPYMQICVGGRGCYDYNADMFKGTISKPCREN